MNDFQYRWAVEAMREILNKVTVPAEPPAAECGKAEAHQPHPFFYGWPRERGQCGGRLPAEPAPPSDVDGDMRERVDEALGKSVCQCGQVDAGALVCFTCLADAALSVLALELKTQREFDRLQFNAANKIVKLRHHRAELKESLHEMITLSIGLQDELNALRDKAVILPTDWRECLRRQETHADRESLIALWRAGNSKPAPSSAKGWSTDRVEPVEAVEDGHGNRWAKCSPTCDLHVVRPGKVQCSCDDKLGEIGTWVGTPRAVPAGRLSPGPDVRDRRTSAPGNRETPGPSTRPLSELRDTGLLWLINRTCLHPRGYALALVLDGQSGEVLGWQLQGDGTEVWSFPPENEEARFQAVNRLLASESTEDGEP